MALAVIIAAAEIGPDQATKNLEAWATRLGLGWPDWLTAHWVFVIVAVIVVVWYGILFQKQLRTVPRRSAAAYRAFSLLPPVTPEVESPSLQEIAAINDVRASVRLAGAPAAERILSLCQDVRATDVKGITFAWLVDKERSRLRDATKRVLESIAERSSERLPSIRQALQDFLAAYGVVVRAVHDFEREGVDLLGKRHADAYAQWEQSNADWIQRLNTIKEQPLLAGLGPDIQKQLHSGADLRYAILFARGRALLESASPAERAFLELFCTERTISPENMIEYSVYDAGRELAQSKVLKLTDGGNGFARFCLPEPVRRGWALHGAAPYPQRECVDIHPNSVRSGADRGAGT